MEVRERKDMPDMSWNFWKNWRLENRYRVKSLGKWEDEKWWKMMLKKIESSFLFQWIEIVTKHFTYRTLFDDLKMGLSDQTCVFGR